MVLFIGEKGNAMKRSDAIKRMQKILKAHHRDLVKALGVGITFEFGVDLLPGVDVDTMAQITSAESLVLQSVEDALERMRRGRYGICEGCGREISLARLQAIPQASLCISCQKEIERREMLGAGVEAE